MAVKESIVLGGGVKLKARGPAAGKRRLPKLNGRLYVGLSIVAVFILGSLVLPLFNSADPAEQGTYLKNLPLNLQHLLGTNALRQDMIWLLVVGIRNPL